MRVAARRSISEHGPEIISSQSKQGGPQMGGSAGAVEQEPCDPSRGRTGTCSEANASANPRASEVPRCAVGLVRCERCGRRGELVGTHFVRFVSGRGARLSHKPQVKDTLGLGHCSLSAKQARRRFKDSDHITC
jgi:hypothetical protein